MLFKAKTYSKYILSTLNKNSIKSTYISDLILNSFKKKSIQVPQNIISYKELLLTNKSNITVTDFGAGSKIFKSNRRKISKIAKYAGISNNRIHHLFSLIRYLNPRNILEIGTSLGIATAAISEGSKKSQIRTLEGCPETARIAKQQFDKFNLKNIDIIIGDFKNTLPKAIEDITYDFIYFDGNHQKSATLKYFNLCLKTVNNNSVFVFDDIHWSKEMEEAWEEIKQHPNVTVTIDTYQWGIVFFRKELEKQHLTIRV
ncbi:MAG: O-methyltransferase [Flavobacteriaceae bacterium]